MGDEREVLLHVYDLSQGMARQMSMAFLGKQIDGIWHTGVVIGNKEYFYGGGIQVEQSGKTVFGQPVETVHLGSTMIPDEVIVDFLRDISSRFSAETYSLLHNNCNNFSDELATFLTGKGIPERITGLPSEFLSTPIGQMIMPMLTPLEAQMKQMNGQAMFAGNNQAGAGATTTSAAAAAPVVVSRPSGMAAAEPVKAPADSVAAADTTKPRTKEEFEAAVKEEFVKLMGKGGLTANEAAAEAFRIAKSQSVRS